MSRLLKTRVALAPSVEVAEESESELTPQERVFASSQLSPISKPPLATSLDHDLVEQFAASAPARPEAIPGPIVRPDGPRKTWYSTELYGGENANHTKANLPAVNLHKSELPNSPSLELHYCVQCVDPIDPSMEGFSEGAEHVCAKCRKYLNYRSPC